MNRSAGHTLRMGVAWIALAAVSACGGGTSPPPQPGQSRGSAPDLRGRSVMLLPVQQVVGVRGDPDAELAFTLKDIGREVDWIEEDEITEVLARTPGMNARTRGLPVGQFLLAEVRRIGDPLYGQLRRMAALVNADWVLLPVAASFEPNEAVIGSGPRVRLTMALIDPRSGDVRWFAVEEGGEFAQDDPRGLASAVERAARNMFWYMGV